MKNLFLLALVLFSFSSNAQTADKVTNEGEVVYLTTVNLHKRIRGDRAEEIKKMIPEFQKMKSVLYFTETEMLYHKLEEKVDVKEEDLQEGRGGFRMRMMGGSPDDRYYTNIDDETVAEKTDFMGKTFLIEDDMKMRQWKLTGEQKTILGYPCQKAELVIKVDTTARKEEDDEGRRRGPRGPRGPREPRAVTAWFTTQIPVSGGPRNYHQLPGMVLEVDIDNGNQIIVAEAVNLKKLETKIIEKPTEGEKVTREEYRKIQKEKMEEMRKEYGGKGKGKGHHGGGGRRVIIQN